MDVWIYYSLFLVLLRRVCNAESVPTEIARLAFPDFLGVVHSRRHGPKCKSFLCVFPNVPGTLAKAPIVVIFAGPTIHHPLLSRLRRSDG